MITLERPYIVYSLPAAKVYQPMKAKKTALAWQGIQDLLNNVTTADPLVPDDIIIKIHAPFDIKTIDPALLEVVDRGEPTERKGEWKMNAKDLPAALQYFENVQPRLKSNYEVHLYLTYSFKLVQPADKTILEQQQLKSLFLVYLARTHVCMPTLFFPFEEASVDFWNYIDAIKAYLPFELEEKYCRLARIKNGWVSSFKKVGRPE
ncbi:hypothetical protein [Ferruginibacter sp.]